MGVIPTGLTHIHPTLLRRRRLDILPALGRGEAHEMANIRGGNDNRVALSREDQRLSGENHIAVERKIRGRGVSMLAGMRPQVGRLQHRVRRDGYVLHRRLRTIEMGDTAEAIGAQQLAPHFIIGDLWDCHRYTGSE